MNCSWQSCWPNPHCEGDSLSLPKARTVIRIPERDAVGEDRTQAQQNGVGETAHAKFTEIAIINNEVLQFFDPSLVEGIQTFFAAESGTLARTKRVAWRR